VGFSTWMTTGMRTLCSSTERGTTSVWQQCEDLPQPHQKPLRSNEWEFVNFGVGDPDKKPLPLG